MVNVLRIKDLGLSPKQDTIRAQATSHRRQKEPDGEGAVKSIFREQTHILLSSCGYLHKIYTKSSQTKSWHGWST